MSAVNLDNVSVRLGARTVLNKVSASARGGEITGLIGPNGAGKSTLLRAIIGLVPHTGVIEIDGFQRLTRQEKAKKIAYLPQLMEINWPLPAKAVVALGRYPHGGFFQSRGKEDEAAIGRALKIADAWAFRERNVMALSAGERARVLLARALAVEAPILLVDEPVATLDPEHQLKVMMALKKLSGEGVAVVIVLHDLTLASRFCDSLTLLNKGRVVAAGKPEEVLSAKNLKSVYKITAKRGKNFVIPWSLSH